MSPPISGRVPRRASRGRGKAGTRPQTLLGSTGSVLALIACLPGAIALAGCGGANRSEGATHETTSRTPGKDLRRSPSPPINLCVTDPAIRLSPLQCSSHGRRDRRRCRGRCGSGARFRRVLRASDPPDSGSCSKLPLLSASAVRGPTGDSVLATVASLAGGRSHVSRLGTLGVTLNRVIAGVGSALPSASIAVTRKTWVPTATM